MEVKIIKNDCGDNYERIKDDLGGIHSEGLGWNPFGEVCGECSKDDCAKCPVWQRREWEEKLCREFEFMKARNINDEFCYNDIGNTYCIDLEFLGIGWMKLLYAACKEIKDLLDYYSCEDFRILQIKEKYGALDIHIGSLDGFMFDRINPILERVYIDSLQVCEICGKSSVPNRSKWIITRCNEHSNEVTNC